MKRSKFSDGIEKFQGKLYQKAFIKVPMDFFVNCPFCSRTIDTSDATQIIKCESCGREFFAEFSLPNAI